MAQTTGSDEMFHAAGMAKAMAERLLELKTDLYAARLLYTSPGDEDNLLVATHEALNAVASYLHDHRMAEEAFLLTVLIGALEDVGNGRSCPLLRVRKRTQENIKEQVEEGQAGRRNDGMVKIGPLANACAAISLLMGDEGMSEKDAAQRVASRLSDAGFNLGRSTVSIYLMNYRNNLIEGSRGEYARALYDVAIEHARSAYGSKGGRALLDCVITSLGKIA